MPTLVHKYLDTASDSIGGTGNSAALSGADRAYRTLKSALAALKTEYPDYRAGTGGDVEIVLHIAATTGVVDSYNESVPVTIEAMLMDDTHGLTITTEFNDPLGVLMPWNTSEYILRQTNSFYTTIRIDALNVTIRGVQMENTGVSTNSAVMIATLLRTNAIIRYENNHIRGAGATTSSNSMGINHSLPVASPTNVRVYANNNFFTGWGYGFRTGDLGGGISWHIAHNTSVDNRFNLAVYKGGVIRLHNNVMQGGKTQDYLWGSSGGTYVTSHNIASDGTGPDAAFNNLTVDFLGAADWHLDPADTVAKAQGLDMRTDTYNPVTVDFDYTLRPATPSIGAFDFAAVVGQTLRPSSVLAAGAWEDEVGGVALAASTSDESDATFARSPEPPLGESATVSLGGASTPQAGSWTSKFRVVIEGP